jgi:hypothetical protein
MSHLLVKTVWKLTAGSSALALLAVGCASKSGYDSETHFFCRADVDCRNRFGDEYGCVASACKKVVLREAATQNPRAETPVDAGGDAPGFLDPLVRRPDANDCFEMTVRPELIHHNIYVLLDNSLAMRSTIPGGTDTWAKSVADGIEGFVEGSYSEAVSMAIQAFPLGSAPDSCTAPYDQPAVELTRLPTNATSITSWLTSLPPPEGVAPTGPALQGGIAYLKAAGSPQSVDFYSVVLIASDSPAGCEPGPQGDMQALAAAGFGGTPRVSTYVIALGGVAISFDFIAAAGGTGQATPVVNGDVRRQVKDAFEGIMGAGVRCEINLPVGITTGRVDAARLDLSFDVVDGSTPITRVGQASDCGSLDRDGWYVDSETAPTKILMCPELCAHPPSRYYHVRYGCH